MKPHWVALGALLTLLVFLLLPRFPRAPAQVASVPGSQDSAPAPPAVHALTGLGKELMAELDHLLSLRYDKLGKPIPGDSGQPFLEAYRLHGPQLLQGLPGQEKFHSWLESGGLPESLPPEIREELREVDSSFRDLGLVPPFHPILTSFPLPRKEACPSVLLEYLEPEGPLPGFFRDPLGGWPGAVRRHLAEGIEEYETIWRFVANRKGTYPFSRSVAGNSGRPGTFGHPLSGFLVRNWFSDPEVVEPLARGRDAVRGFLYSSLRTIDENLEETPWLQSLVILSSDSMMDLLQGSYLQGDAQQLLGPSCRSYWGLTTQAFLLRRLRLLRQRFLILGPVTQDDEIELWRRAFELSLRSGSRETGLEAWTSLLLALEKTGETRQLQDLYSRHCERLLPLLVPGERERWRRFEQRLSGTPD